MTDLKVLSGHWRVEFGHQSMLKQHALLQRCGRLTERCDHSSSGHFFRLIPEYEWHHKAGRIVQHRSQDTAPLAIAAQLIVVSNLRETTNGTAETRPKYSRNGRTGTCTTTRLRQSGQ